MEHAQKMKKRGRFVKNQPLLVAAGEGFEPSHTESESAVLPLHNPAKGIDYYTQIQHNVKDYLPLSLPHNNS